MPSFAGSALAPGLLSFPLLRSVSDQGENHLFHAFSACEKMLGIFDASACNVPRGRLHCRLLTRNADQGDSPMSVHDSFDALQARLKAGDADAAAEIFHRYARRLIALAREHLSRQLQQKVDPEDVLQSAFRTFFRRQACGEFELQDWDNLWALLSVITLRKCGHQAEYYLAMCRDVKREKAPALAGDSMAQCEAIAREPTPVEAVMLAETVQFLLERMMEQDREVVSLRLQDYSAEEIAASLGRPLRSVYRALERARKCLRELHAEEAMP
jgi:RNA polymerase sigma-70 factor, ECF subfamily